MLELLRARQGLETTTIHDTQKKSNYAPKRSDFPFIFINFNMTFVLALVRFLMVDRNNLHTHTHLQAVDNKLPQQHDGLLLPEQGVLLSTLLQLSHLKHQYLRYEYTKRNKHLYKVFQGAKCAQRANRQVGRADSIDDLQNVPEPISIIFFSKQTCGSSWFKVRLALFSRKTRMLCSCDMINSISEPETMDLMSSPEPEHVDLIDKTRTCTIYLISSPAL